MADFVTAERFSQLVGVDLTPSFLGNTLFSFAIAITVFIVLTFAFRFLQWGVLRRLDVLAKRTDTDIDDTAIAIMRSLRPAFYYFLAFFIAIRFLALSSVVENIIEGALLIWIVYQAVIAIQILINQVLRRRVAGDGADPGTKAAVGYLNVFVKIGLWSMGILLVLSNFGVNITSLVAGLGIGGIAIAFALQNILGDLFSSFAIYFDKPFEIGDFIIVGSHAGTVEKVGIKTTRLRSLSGEEIVIPNQELTGTRVQNFKRMDRRRIVFAFGVTYDTPTKQLAAIPKLLEDIITNVPDVVFDRTHFKSFGESALEFEVVYYVNGSDYDVHVARQHEINLALKEQFENESIAFAYPTRTVLLEKGK